ncbi:DUF6377 domain-containing protein [Mucilaginibacter sp.]
MRLYYTLFIFLICSAGGSYAGSPNASLFKRLHIVLAKRETYIQLKEARIKKLENRLSSTANLNTRFTIYEALYNEYKSFRYDSAYSYSKKLQAIANQLHDPAKMAVSKMNISFTLLSSGMFKETLETLNEIDIALLNKSNKAAYYFLKARCYFDWGDFNHNTDYSNIYYPKALFCIDSALAVSPEHTYNYWALNGLKNMRIQRYTESVEDYLHLLQLPHLTPNQYAVTASSLSYVYSTQGKQEQAIALLIKAAIADIQSATKETVAMYQLANILYKSGKEDEAFTYINEAIDEANFYGARHRQAVISSILPIIEAQRIKTIEDERRSLLIYSSIITLLVIAVITFAVIINRQLKKIRLADQIIQAANVSLQQSNTALAEVNQNLSVANKIKNEYISYYFNINSVYIERLEGIQKSLEKKLKNQRYEDALHTLKNLNLESERHELFHTFDKVFLRLFPEFIPQFNSLFREPETISIPAGQLLGTEHRIFALIRMGIHDNERIAKLLGYSVNTIYAYKNRIKTKSWVVNDEFEGKIMAIEAV